MKALMLYFICTHFVYAETIEDKIRAAKQRQAKIKDIEMANQKSKLKKPRIKLTQQQAKQNQKLSDEIKKTQEFIEYCAIPGSGCMDKVQAAQEQLVRLQQKQGELLTANQRSKNRPKR